jgi:Ca2+-binding EF-hand superfamily protein
MVLSEQGSAKYGVMGPHGQYARRFSFHSDFLVDIVAQDRSAVRRSMLEEIRRKRDLRDKVQALDVTGDLKKIFKGMDTDRDGTISLSELMSGLIDHGVEMSEADVQFLHERMDADGDGEVSIKEFKEFMREDLSNKAVETRMREISAQNQKDLLKNIDMNRTEEVVKDEDERNKRIRRQTTLKKASELANVDPLVEQDEGVSKEWRADDWTEIRQRLLAKRKKFGAGQSLAFFLALKKAGQPKNPSGRAYTVELDNEPTSMTFDNFRRSLAMCGMKGAKCREAVDPLMEELDKTGMKRVYMDTLQQFLDGNRRQIASPFHRRLAGIRGFSSNSGGGANAGGGGSSSSSSSSLRKTQGKYGQMGDKRKHCAGARMERFDDKYSISGMSTDVMADRSECRRVQLREMAHKRRLRQQIAQLSESGAMREMFEQMDGSGDGAVDVTELTQGLKAAGVHMSPTELHYVFMNYDTDHSGGITWEEFNSFMNKDLSNHAVEEYMVSLQETARIATLNTHTDYRSAKHCKEDDAKLQRTVVKLGEGGSEADMRAAVRARLVEKRMQLGGGGLFFTTLKRMGHPETDPQRAIEALKFDPYPRSIPFTHFKRALAAWGVQLGTKTLAPLMLDLSLEETWLERVGQQQLLDFVAGKQIKKRQQIAIGKGGKQTRQTPASSAKARRVAKNQTNSAARGLRVPDSDRAGQYSTRWMDDEKAAQWVSRDKEQAMATLRQQAENAVLDALAENSSTAVGGQTNSLRYGGAGGMDLVDRIMEEQYEQQSYPAREAENDAAVRIQSTIRRKQSYAEVKQVKQQGLKRDWEAKQKAAAEAAETRQSVRSRVLRGLYHQRELCKHYMQPLSAARAVAASELGDDGEEMGGEEEEEEEEVDALFFDSLRLLGASTADPDKSAAGPLVDRTVSGKLIDADGTVVGDLRAELGSHGAQRGMAEGTGSKVVQLKDASISFKLFRRALREWGLPNDQSVDSLFAELDVLGTKTVCRRALITMMKQHQEELAEAAAVVAAAAACPMPELAPEKSEKRPKKMVRKGGGAWVEASDSRSRKPVVTQRNRLGSFMRVRSDELAHEVLEESSRQRNHKLTHTGGRNASDTLRLHATPVRSTIEEEAAQGFRAAFIEGGGTGAELLLHLGRSESFVEGQLAYQMAMDYASHCETEGERMTGVGGATVRHHKPKGDSAKKTGGGISSSINSSHRPWYTAGQSGIPALDESQDARYLDLAGGTSEDNQADDNLTDPDEAHAILATATGSTSAAAATAATAGVSANGTSDGTSSRRKSGGGLFGLRPKTKKVKKKTKKRRVRRAKAVVPSNADTGGGGHHLRARNDGLDLDSSLDISAGNMSMNTTINESMSTTIADSMLTGFDADESTDADFSVIASALGLAMTSNGTMTSQINNSGVSGVGSGSNGASGPSAPMLHSLQTENGKLKAMVQCLAENLKLRVSVNQLSSALDTQQLPGSLVEGQGPEEQEQAVQEEGGSYGDEDEDEEEYDYKEYGGASAAGGAAGGMASDSQGSDAKAQLLVSISEALNSIGQSEMLVSSHRQQQSPPRNTNNNYRPHTAPADANAATADASASRGYGGTSSYGSSGYASPQAKVLSFAGSSPQTPQPKHFQSLRPLSPKTSRRPKGQKRRAAGGGKQRGMPVSHSR